MDVFWTVFEMGCLLPVRGEYGNSGHHGPLAEADHYDCEHDVHIGDNNFHPAHYLHYLDYYAADGAGCQGGLGGSWGGHGTRGRDGRCGQQQHQVRRDSRVQ